MRDYINIGPVPTSELCSQIGTENFYLDSRIECEVFADQLLRVFPNKPAGCRITTKSFEHDFGTYREVVVFYDDENEEQQDYAYLLEGKTPEYWDDDAIKKLTEKNYSLVNQIDHTAEGQYL